MRSFPTLALLVFAGTHLCRWTKASLILTGVVDGPLTGGLPKAVELYATTDIIIDLSAYQIVTYFNGAPTSTSTVALSDTSLAAGSFYYLTNDAAGFETFFGFTADQEVLGSSINANGDDVYELQNAADGTVVDVHGVVGVDGTDKPWEFRDGWAYRVDGTGPEATFRLASWIYSGTNALDGETTNSGARTPFPIGTYVQESASPMELVRIHEIQGDGATSPLEGETVTIEAVVVGDFQNGDADTSRNLGGFFVQEENTDIDGDPLTSEGIFVYEGSASFIADVEIGDLVKVTGTVDEFFSQTQITVTNIEIISSSNPLPTAAEIALPYTDLEAYEGMRVTFLDTLTINEMFNLDRFNEITLVQGERPFQYSQMNTPDVAGYAASLQDIASRQITYDDGLSVQNAPIGNLDGFGPTYSTATDIRMGDTIDNLSGVLFYSFGAWRVTSAEDGENTFTKVNSRPAVPTIPGRYKIASVNVLNYFTTHDVSGGTTAIGMDPRGADDVEEFDRQTEKLVQAIVDMDADILGLVELENDFLPGSSGNALDFLVHEVNAELGADIYDWVNPGQQFVDGSDAISNGFMYKKNIFSIRRGTQPAILRDEDLEGLGLSFGNAVFNGPSSNRPPLTVDFQPKRGFCLMVSINHFKSKGSVNGAPGNADAGDGAGANNAIRVQAAEALTTWMETYPTGRFCPFRAIIGDLNSYASEDPITTIESLGYTNVEKYFSDDEAYSYVFDGQLGTLDYIMVSRLLLWRSRGAEVWHVNTDEPDANDYNTDFGRDTSIFDGSVPFRFSDHDPLIMGFW